jgi:carboxylesterase
MAGTPRTWPLARPDVDGFELQGRHGATCLLLHGFTASPAEVRPLAEALAAAGFPVKAVRLPGHGTSDEELDATAPAAWSEAAEAALKSSGPPVLVAGCSMGGLLALRLAARHPDRVRAVATLGAPLWFADRRARVMIPLLRWTPLGRVVRYLPKGPSQIPEANRVRHFTYQRFPVRGLFGLQDLMREALSFVPEVTAPLLVIHGKNDRTAPPVSARRIHAMAGSADKELVEMENSRHVLTYDVEAEAVVGHVVRFFGRHA